MPKVTTVALVETATQLHNVVEWAHATDSVDEVRVDVLAPTDRQSMRQLTRVAALARGMGVDVRHRSVRARNSSAATSTLAVARDIRSADRLVLGDPFSHYIQTLLPLVRADHIVAVDDGTATWEFVSCLDANKPMVRWRKPLEGATALEARATKLLTPSVRRRLTVFSCLRDATPVGASRVDNKYSWARAWRTPEIIDDRVDVLGISLVDSGLVERAAYVDAVAALVRRHAPVRYLAHRRESDSLVAEIDTLPGVTVVRADLPAELALRKGPVSRRVITFPSTASHTLPVVLGDLMRDQGLRIDVRPVDPSWFTPSTTKHARDFVARIAAVAPRAGVAT
ncbi:hypothetical protein [uncultured Jatrophihabitans sp.]|uniref:hypothetical protein n=1 Tax=uncultured Jatrophihabitans sp. TaxID=1610747 RepID=UPI0035CC3D9C